MVDLNSILHSENAANIQLVINAQDLRECFESWMQFALQQQKEREEDPYYTREQLAKMLHVSAPTLISYRKKGLIPKPIILDGRTLYRKAEVNEAIEGNVRLKLKSVRGGML